MTIFGFDVAQMLQAAGVIALLAMTIELVTWTKRQVESWQERKASVEAARQRDIEAVVNSYRAQIDELKHQLALPQPDHPAIEHVAPPLAADEHPPVGY